MNNARHYFQQVSVAALFSMLGRNVVLQARGTLAPVRGAVATGAVIVGAGRQT